MKDKPGVSIGSNTCTSFDAMRQVDRDYKALPLLVVAQYEASANNINRFRHLR
jgi:hypothetical protein